MKVGTDLKGERMRNKLVYDISPKKVRKKLYFFLFKKGKSNRNRIFSTLDLLPT